MAETTETDWQAVARKRYPKMLCIGGDGCWIVLTKCPHPQTNNWRYALRPTKEAAEALLAKWATDCGTNTCDGPPAHSLWRIT